MLEYYGKLRTFYCISNTFVFYCFDNFYDVVPINKLSVDTIVFDVKSRYPICSITEFEKAFITDLNDDDNIYLYLKVKGENQ